MNSARGRSELAGLWQPSTETYVTPVAFSKYAERRHPSPLLWHFDVNSERMNSYITTHNIRRVHGLSNMYFYKLRGRTMQCDKFPWAGR